MRKLIIVLSSLFFLASAPVFAVNTKAEKNNDITLHVKRDINSKITGTIKSGDPVIPIFYNGDWIKVGDPQTGSVGWVNKDTFRRNHLPQIFTKTITQSSDKDGKNSYHVIQYSGAVNLDTKQIKTMMRRIQIQQRHFQHSMDKMMSDTMHDMRNLEKSFWSDNDFRGFPFRVLQPVIIVHDSGTASHHDNSTVKMEKIQSNKVKHTGMWSRIKKHLGEDS